MRERERERETARTPRLSTEQLSLVATKSRPPGCLGEREIEREKEGERETESDTARERTIVSESERERQIERDTESRSNTGRGRIEITQGSETRAPPPNRRRPSSNPSYPSSPASSFPRPRPAARGMGSSPGNLKHLRHLGHLGYLSRTRPSSWSEARLSGLGVLEA